VLRRQAGDGKVNVIELIFFIVVAAFSWCLALSKTVRTKMPSPWWLTSAVNKEEDQRSMKDILFRVVGVTSGLLFSLLSVVALLQKLP